MNDALKEQISAYVDGELPEHETELLVRRLAQDSQLRDLLSSYMTVGRSMRREPEVAAMRNLRQRISAALDDQEEIAIEPTTPAGNRFAKPLAGVAVAASVAVLALVGLQQTTDRSAAKQNAPALVASNLEAEAVQYTVPVAIESGSSNMLTRYYVKHGEAVMAYGSNGINSRLVSLELEDSEIFETRLEQDEREIEQDVSGNQ